MRLTLLLGMLLAPVLAQPVDLDQFLPHLGRPWTEAMSALPTPDASTLADGTGQLVWVDVEDSGSPRTTVAVVEGRVARILLHASVEEWPEFKHLEAEAARELGEPGPDGFHRWAQVRGNLEADVTLPSDFPPLDMMFSATKRALILRVAEE